MQTATSKTGSSSCAAMLFEPGDARRSRASHTPMMINGINAVAVEAAPRARNHYLRKRLRPASTACYLGLTDRAKHAAERKLKDLTRGHNTCPAPVTARHSTSPRVELRRLPLVTGLSLDKPPGVDQTGVGTEALAGASRSVLLHGIRRRQVGDRPPSSNQGIVC